MGKKVDQLNECARIFYASLGYQVKEGYDFEHARHPTERSMFILAVKSFNFWKKAQAKNEPDPKS